MSVLQIFKKTVRENRVILVGLVLASFFVYANSVQNEFVSDDLAAIVENKSAGDVIGNVKKYQTVTDLEKSLVFHIAGKNPLLHHVNNIIWNAGVVVLVFFLVWAVSKNKKLGVVSSFLYAVHPIHTESVTWISGFPYLISTFFVFLTLLIYVLSDQGILSKRWKMVSLFLSLVSYFAMEKTVFLPGVIFVYELLYSGWRKAFLRTIPFALVLGIYVFVVWSRLTVVISERTFQSLTPTFSPLVQLPVAISTYIRLLFLPVNLTLYHEAFVLSTGWFVFDVLLAVLALVLTGVLFYKREKSTAFFILFFWLGLIPTLLPFKLSWIVAERYVYLSSIGFVVALGSIFLAIEKRNKDVFWVLLIVILSLYSFLTVKRNFEWRSQDTLWPATVAASPFSSLAHNNMGDYYSRRGDWKMAAEEFNKAISLRPTFADAIHNLGNVYMQVGQATVAAQLYTRALSINPKLLDSFVNLSVAKMSFNDWKGAEEVLLKAQRTYPNSLEVYNALAVYYFQIGDKDRAVAALEKVLILDPENEKAKMNLELIRR